MNIAVKLAGEGELPCEGYPIRAITVEGGDVPEGYDQVLTVSAYTALRDSFAGTYQLYQATHQVDETWERVIARRNLELTATDWTASASVALMGYQRLIAYRIYRQRLRDVTEPETPDEVVWPSLPDDLLVLNYRPIISESNMAAWTDLLWRACYDFRFDLISDEGVVKVNTLADANFAKAIYIRNWIDSLWMNVYYPRKAALLSGGEVNFDFKTGNEPTYTVWEALSEAM